MFGLCIMHVLCVFFVACCCQVHFEFLTLLDIQGLSSTSQLLRR